MAEIVLQQTPAPRAAVQRMRAYHPPLGGREGLRLDFNENTVACSPRVLEALAQVAAGDLAKYPERGQVEARVAQHLGLDAPAVLLTNGVDEAIHVLCQTYLDRGDEFLFPTPTYSMYEVYGSCTDATVRTVPSDEAFAFPLEAILAAITPAPTAPRARWPAGNRFCRFSMVRRKRWCWWMRRITTSAVKR
jgi:histidinol-phosphate aminotransferase